MTIGEYIRKTNREEYYKLINMFKKKEIKLGCSVEELMRADSYKKVRGKVKQRGWR